MDDVGTMIEAKAVMYFEADRAGPLEVTTTSVSVNLTAEGRAIEQGVNAALQCLYPLWTRSNRERREHVQQLQRDSSSEHPTDLAEQWKQTLEQAFGPKWTRIEIVLHRRV